MKDADTLRTILLKMQETARVVAAEPLSEEDSTRGRVSPSFLKQVNQVLRQVNNAIPTADLGLFDENTKPNLVTYPKTPEVLQQIGFALTLLGTPPSTAHVGDTRRVAQHQAIGLQTDRDEYKKFMAYLYNEYVRNRLEFQHRRLSEDFHAREMRWDWWEELTQASRAVRRITRIPEDRFTSSLESKNLPFEVLRGLVISNRAVQDAGFLDVFDDYYMEIVEGMKIEDMPAQELEVLRRLGSEDPETELTALIYLVRSRSRSSRQLGYNIRVSNHLQEAEKILEHHWREIAKLRETNKKQLVKSRRWFKGLGQIAQGSALSVANVWLAIGTSPFPVAVETATWGSLVSSVTGVGMVLNGIDEWRGE